VSAGSEHHARARQRAERANGARDPLGRESRGTSADGEASGSETTPTDPTGEPDPATERTADRQAGTDGDQGERALPFGNAQGEGGTRRTCVEMTSDPSAAQRASIAVRDLQPHLRA
jgi:hypothetical protein